jgi:hypothetical protein
MDVRQHLERAARLLVSTRKLQPHEHFAAVVEGYMHACTHLLNALLHEEAITSADDDVVHTNMPYIAITGAGLARVREAMAALRVIEDMRILYVRGNVAVSTAAITELLETAQAVQRATASHTEAGV